MEIELPIIFAFDVNGKAIAPRLSAKLKAGLVSGAVDYPVITGDSFEVNKIVFSGKATATYQINSDIKIIALLPNSFPLTSASYLFCSALTRLPIALNPSPHI